MLGELGHSLGVREIPIDIELLPKATYYNEPFQGRDKVILLPGIAPSVGRSFSKQIEALKESGRSVVGLDYPQRGFDLQAIENTLCCEVGFNEKVSVIASSFGARVITEILLKNTILASRLHSLVFLGPFMYLDRKNSFLSLLASANSVVPFESIGPVRDILVSAARSRFRYDPGYYTCPEDKKIMEQETHVEGLGARMAYFGQKPNLSGNIKTPTTIVWWGSEPASNQQKMEIMSVYDTVSIRHLDGRHAFTSTNADQLNILLAELVDSDGI